MSRQAKIATIVISVAVAIGLLAAFAWPVIYRDFIAAPAAETPSVQGESTPEAPGLEGTGDPLSANDLAGVWQISAGSQAGYRVDEVLNGTDVTVTGRTTEVSGSVTVEQLTLTDANIEIDVASISTDRSARDSYFRDDAMRVAEFPVATFELTSAPEPQSAPVSGEVSQLDLTGNLTLAGVTHEVTFTSEWVTDGRTAQVAGSIPITFADYGVEAPSLGFVKVEPNGFVEFDLILTKD